MVLRRTDKEKLRMLLTEAVLVLCKSGLQYNSEILIEGLIGVTLDKADTFIVNINKTAKAAHEDTDSDSEDSGSNVGSFTSKLKSSHNKFVNKRSHSESPIDLSCFPSEKSRRLNENETSQKRFPVEVTNNDNETFSLGVCKQEPPDVGYPCLLPNYRNYSVESSPQNIVNPAFEVQQIDRSSNKLVNSAFDVQQIKPSSSKTWNSPSPLSIPQVFTTTY